MRKITRSIRSSSDAQTSSITDRMLVSYSLFRVLLKVVAGLVYIRSRCRLLISMPLFSTSTKELFSLVAD